MGALIMRDITTAITFLENKENYQLLVRGDKCDKFDYIAAVACGAIGGMIDVFLVGAPKDSTLVTWTDKQVDKVVMEFAKRIGWNPKAANINNVNSAIGYLEREFGVNYDQRKPSDVGDLFNIAPNTHHMMSLAHAPDILGLFFSILNQFTSTSSFISSGQLVSVKSDTFELQGGNVVAKIMCGITNWLGHLMSDVAGSSGSHGRGTGIVIPFYELFGLCKFGDFSVNDIKKDLSEIALSAFNQGYDFRFGVTMEIPVVVTDLLIKLVWALRRHFQYGYAIKDCIPSAKYNDLRIMLLFGNGTLCVIDGLDASLKSGGNFLLFFMRVNLIAWFRFVTLVLKEICIRAKFSGNVQLQIEAYRRINEALQIYLNELEKIDIKLFKKETEKYNAAVASFMDIKDEKELNKALLLVYEQLGIKKPWEGDFNEHMSNKNATLIFE